MKTKQIVKELEAAVRQLGVKVRVEGGSFRGGYCKRGEEELLVLNKRHPPEMHLAVLAESLRVLPVETIFLRPSVRNALEEMWARHAPIDAAGTDVE